MAPTNIFVPGVPSIGKVRRRVDLGAGNDGIFNYNPAYLANWRSARDAALAGTANAFLSYGYGDSTTAGTGVQKVNSAPNKLAQKLAAIGLSVSNEGFYATHGSSTPSALDPNLSVGAGWNIATGQVVYSGRSFLYSSGSTAISYTPYASVDTWDIYYVAYNAGGILSFTVDGGAEIANIDTTNASTLVQFFTLTVPAGTHRLDITRTSGTPIVLAAIGRTAATKQIKVYNGGFGGGTVATYISGGASSYNPRQMFKTLAPKLSIISLTINDANTATNTTTYQTSMDTLIADGKISGDVIVMDGPPSQATTVPVATQKTYRDIARARAIANNCVYISLTDRWGSWEAKNPLGWYYDNLHPSATGYDDIATVLASLLAR
jgi:lysophospholipase L1-like esterase